VNWKGWALAFVRLILVGYLMFTGGYFMHGD
jgi:hypothetical protein